MAKDLLCKQREERWGYDEVQAHLKGKKVYVPDSSPIRLNFVYTLTQDQVAHSIEELGELMLKNPEEAKKHIRKRLIYERIKGVDQYLAARIDDIQSEAKNMEECLVEVIYNLNPK